MTSEMYSSIAINKTAFYSFFLPVALALHYFQRVSEVNLKQAERILLLMGGYFQIQDDYLDVFGNPEVTGKVDTDIQDNKCSWIIVQALQRCNDDQREVFVLVTWSEGRRARSECQAGLWPDIHGRSISAVRGYEDQRASWVLVNQNQVLVFSCDIWI